MHRHTRRWRGGVGSPLNPNKVKTPANQENSAKQRARDDIPLGRILLMEKANAAVREANAAAALRRSKSEARKLAKLTKSIEEKANNDEEEAKKKEAEIKRKMKAAMSKAKKELSALSDDTDD